MTMTKQERAEKKRLAAECEARIQVAHEVARNALMKNCCPTCGKGTVRNLALTGWVQCEQYGAQGFRKDSSAPACSWQGFTR